MPTRRERRFVGMAPKYGFALAKVTGLTMHGDMMIGAARRRYDGRRAYEFMACGYTWASVVSGSAVRLHGRFPFVGDTPTLCIPLVAGDAHAVFARIRPSFPRAFGS